MEKTYSPRRALRRTLKLLVASALALVVSLPAAAARAEGVTPDVKSDNIELVSSTVFCKGGQFTNHGGDMAFWGDTAVMLCGNDDGHAYNDGIVIADISDPERPKELGRFYCVDSASDIAMWNHLVFLAVDRNGEDKLNSGPVGTECDTKERARYGEQFSGTPLDRSAEIFRGFRIVDISIPAEPRIVTSVTTWTPEEDAARAQEDRGAGWRGPHTLTVLPQRDASGEVSELVVTTPNPGDKRNLMVTVPVDAPTEYRKSFFSSGRKWGCHDISFFVPRGIAVCPAVESGTVIWDVRDDAEVTFDDGASPTTPIEIAYLPLPNDTVRAHSAAFSWDGDTLVVGNENTANQPTWSCVDDGELGVAGGLFFYDISNLFSENSVERVVYKGYQAPHFVPGAGWCTAVNMNVLPLPNGRDVVSVGWYAGGTTVVDFTDPSDPKEIAHFIAAPGDPDYASLSRGSYWYRGYIWVNNVHGCLLWPGCIGPKNRGLDVLKLDAQHPTLREYELEDALHLPEFDFGRQECLPVPSGEAHEGRVGCESQVATTLTLTFEGKGSSRHALRATLVEKTSGSPVSGQTVRFLANGASFAAGVTDAFGQAVTELPPHLRGSHNSFSVAFDGGHGFAPSSAP